MGGQVALPYFFFNNPLSDIKISISGNDMVY